MSLKSFPNNIDDRRVVWCLSQDTIDTALNDKSTSELLLAPNVTVIQLPLSRIAKRKSDKLCELDKLGLLKVDQVLVCSDEGVDTKEKYLNLEEVIDDFLTYNLKKANAYARFFAALGATSFEFEHKNFDFSNSKVDFSASLDGAASRVAKANTDLTAKVAELDDQVLIDNLLTPTKIYVNALLPLIKAGLINGVSHITGGGFIENIPRMFSDELAAEITEGTWNILPIFDLLEKTGKIAHQEMFEIFNMGLGMVLAISPENLAQAKALLTEPSFEIGKIVKRDSQAVIIK